MGLTRDNIKKRLASLDHSILDELESLRKPPEIARRTERDLSGIAGDEPLVAGGAVPTDTEEAGVDAGSSSDSSSSSTAQSSSSSAGGIAGDVGGDYHPPAFICGMKVGLEEHPEQNSRGIRVRCGAHHKCRKFCSLSKSCFDVGPRSAEVFVGAWLRLAAPDKRSHKALLPNKAQMQSYAATLP